MHQPRVMAFHRDMVLNIPFVADLNIIRDNRQQLIESTSNRKRVSHTITNRTNHAPWVLIVWMLSILKMEQSPFSWCSVFLRFNARPASVCLSVSAPRNPIWFSGRVELSGRPQNLLTWTIADVTTTCFSRIYCGSKPPTASDFHVTIIPNMVYYWAYFDPAYKKPFIRWQTLSISV
jgi:hypothetical protein